MKAGYVAVIGKTNAGKSTLINKIIGQKINIVSPKQQTTRNNVLGVYTKDEVQLVFIDTPGIHKSANALDKFMNKSIKVAYEGADVVVYLLDGTKRITEDEIEYVKNVTDKGIPVIVAVSKLDIADKQRLMSEMIKLNQLNACEIVPISSEKNKNIDALIKMISERLPQVERYIFDEDEITDKSISFLCAETVREKILRYTNQEIPHGVLCVVARYDDTKKITEIDVDVICEKESHKAIIIGKGGESLKRIGASSRIDIEKLINKKVMLKLFVKVKEGWRNNPNFLSENGYKLD